MILSLTFESFERLYQSFRFRPEIGELFLSLAKTNPSFITFEEFDQFLILEQKVEYRIQEYV